VFENQGKRRKAKDWKGIKNSVMTDRIKEIGVSHIKAFGWMGFYFFLQLFIWLSFMFGYLGILLLGHDPLGVFSFTQTGDVNKELIELLIEGLIEITTQPSLMGVGIVMIVLFTRSKRKFLSLSSHKPPPQTLRELFDFNRLALKDAFFYILLGIILNLLLSPLETVFAKLSPDTSNAYTSLLGEILTGNPLLLLLGVGIIAPIAEEILFRFFVYENLKKVSVLYASVFSSFLFGLMHLNPIQGIYGFLLGLLFVHQNNKKQSIAPSCLMHIGINSSTILLSFFG